MAPKLILMRHGQSAWNQKNLFTGWVDIPMDEVGVQESIEGGKKIRDIPVDVIYTSTLVRAQTTVVLAMMHHASGKIPVFQHPGEGRLAEWSHINSDATREGTIPVFAAWELNERMYGDLQGLNKAETAKKYGDEQVRIWRRSFDVAPPNGESLKMTAARTIPYFQKQIVPHLQKGESAFVVAHGNSLRSIVMHLEGLSNEEVLNLEIATGAHRVYTYEKGKWTKLPSA